MKSEKASVLLVDDTVATSFVIQCMLETIGYDVECAFTGTEAVEKVVADRYLAVLMDVEMPDMDGIDATKAIRAKESVDLRPPLRIIGITGHTGQGIKLLCQRAGMDDFLPKPFVMSQLAEKLQGAVP